MSTLTAWRLTKTKYAATALSGYGSTLRAGRWHARGRPMIYAASSAALALLETLVHAEQAEWLHAAYVVVRLEIPESLVERIETATLPDDWRQWPHPASTQRIGTRWFDERRSAALIVPSAVVPHEMNVLLNPLHPRFHEIEVGAPEIFPIDPRIVLMAGEPGDD